MLGDFPDVPTPTPLEEIALLRAFAGVKVIGLAINHEDMTDAEVSAAIILYELELGIPATDALKRPVGKLVGVAKAYLAGSCTSGEILAAVNITIIAVAPEPSRAVCQSCL